MIDYLKIYNLVKECERTFAGDLFIFLLILIIGILSYDKIKTFVLLFLISLGIILFHSIDYFKCQKELKKAKIDNVKLFKENVEKLKVNYNNNEIINKTLNEFYYNEKKESKIETYLKK